MQVKVFLVFFAAMGILAGIHYYLARRCFQCIRYWIPNLHPGVCPVLFGILMVFMVLGFARSMLPVPEKVKQVLELMSSYYMGFFVYLLFFTILIDLALLMGQWMKLISLSAPKLRFVSGMTVLALTAGTVGYGIFHAGQAKVVPYEITVQGKTMKQDWNIVMISDVHMGAIGSEERLETIVDTINGLEPDLVCIAGDFFDSDYESIRNPEKAVELWKQLRTTYGVYACLGNHDAGGTFSQMQEFLDDAGIHVLHDAYTVIEDQLVLVGRVDPSPIGAAGGLARKAPEAVLEGADTGLPMVVLDHNPINIGEYGREVDLILCGHTHKGQIFPGSIVTNALYTVDHGYYCRDDVSPQVIVSSGVGTWGMPMRVGTDSEIVQIKLHSEND